jgi:hypothetical protein
VPEYRLDCELSKEIHFLWRDRGCEIFPEAAVLVLPAQIYKVPTSKRTIIAIDFKQLPLHPGGNRCRSA